LPTGAGRVGAVTTGIGAVSPIAGDPVASAAGSTTTLDDGGAGAAGAGSATSAAARGVVLT